MFKVAVQSSKGGVAKTTTAKELAYYATKSGYKTIILDTDVNASLLDFANDRYKKYGDEVANIEIEHYSGTALDSKLEYLENKGFELCIIDTHGDFTEVEQAVVENVDMVIMPVEPETTTIKATIKLVNYLEEEIEKRGDNLPYLAIVYVAYDKREVAARESIKEMEGFDLLDFDQHLHDFGAKYRLANKYSLTVQECYESLKTKSKREEFARPAIQLNAFGKEFIDAAVQLNLLEQK
tara:strand:- start:622 stop:1335 length:714 start_codon:yes stop_codon:yes gene_type:complete